MTSLRTKIEKVPENKGKKNGIIFFQELVATWRMAIGMIYVSHILKDSFLQFSIKKCCGYSLESPQPGDSNEYRPVYVFMEK